MSLDIGVDKLPSPRPGMEKRHATSLQSRTDKITGINRIIHFLREPMTESEVLRFVNGRWKMPDCKYLKEIILYVNDEFRVFKRP